MRSSGWGRAPMLSPAEAQRADLTRYIKGEIEQKNFVGLLGEELDNMVNTLVTCSSRREVYEWCQVLVIGEELAAEVIKRRDNNGPYFEDSPEGLHEPGLSVQRTSKKLTVMSKNKKRKKITPSTKAQGGVASTAVPQLEFSECGCFATEHDFRGNCANCGRIICERESYETCYKCGLDPSLCVAYEIKVQDGVLSAAAQQKNREAYEAAVARRDELLKHSENRTKRTKVIDDQAAVLLAPKHAWMTPSERHKADKDEALAERKRKVAAMHRMTGAYTVHLDIMNQNVSLGCPEPPSNEGCISPSSSSSSASVANAPEEDADPLKGGAGFSNDVRAMPLPSLMQKIWYSLDGSVCANSTGTTGSSAAPIVDAGSTNNSERARKETTHRLVEVSRRVQQDYYEEDSLFFALVEREHNRLVSDSTDGLNSNNECCTEVRSQNGVNTDKNEGTESSTDQAVKSSGLLSPLVPTPVMLMNDDGVCLSMHQPWAGLLVAGIKAHEGRTWSTNYRGKLWIHAASSEPHDIAEVEKRYSKFLTTGQSFPKHYPTRVLLGYVFIMDCMDLAKYEATYSEEQRQEGSPFLFICVPGKALSFPLPMSGNHKLFRLDHKVHVAARKQLLEIT
uniref:ASCH domain-containing protein n=1 Tax=Trypanosoma vivax (strain Y486) TaxID=1055687 RepID=G0TVX9_TRYVY|nr:conserved hypothetical protein [Trypanosoma vivax Y486]